MRLEDFLSQSTAPKAFEKGHTIFTEGQQAEAAYYVLEGEVEILKEDGARPSLIAKLGPGEIFGEMALLRFDQYTLSARAATAVKAYAISPALLQEQLHEAHPLIRALLDMLVERMQGANQVLIDLDRAGRG
jgi:CRP-like cAMP-binding protein